MGLVIGLRPAVLARGAAEAALNFRCQCTQQKLQSICAVLTFDPQLEKILTFSVKDRYQLNYFICIKDFSTKSRDLADENNKILTEWK
jgi:hypothetical protein